MSTHTKLCLLLGLGVLVGCGDNEDLVCKTGTFRDGADCVAADPNDKTAPITAASPSGSKARSLPGFVVLSSEEAGVTIHYTLDGSEPSLTSPAEPSPVLLPTIASGTTLKYFGVDAAGNVEATHIETYELDITGPAPVTGLSVAMSGHTATLTWTNPQDADYTGTLVARIDSIADGAPVNGQLYTAPIALSSSVQVLSTASATTYADADRPSGPVRYIVWTYDDLGNYSEPVSVSGNVGTVDTAATFTFDTASSTLVLTAAPQSVDLTGTTATYVGTDVTLHLSIKNATAVYFQNPKVLVTSVTNAAFTGADGTAGTSDFASIGPGFFAPGATKTKDLVFSGAAAATTVTIELELREDPSLLAGWHRGCCSSHPHRLIDLGSGDATVGLTFSSGGRDSGRLGGISRRGFLVGNRYLDIPTSEASVERWDMVTMTKVGGVSIAMGDRTSIMTLLRQGVNEYAVVKAGGLQNSGSLQLVRLNESLKRTGSLQLSGTTGRGFTTSAISPDGKYIAIPANEEIVLVDIATLTVKDLDPSTALVDKIRNVFDNGDRIRALTFANDSSTIVAVGFGGAIGVVKLTATGFTKLPTVFGGARGNAVERHTDGRIWIALENSLRIYDPSDDSITATAYSPGAYALEVLDGQLWVLRSSDRATVDRVDDTGVVQDTMAFSQQAYGHWLMSTTR
jgi:hypothetical protein